MNISGVILTLPLVHFPTRRAVNFVLFPNQEFSWVKHIAVMVGLIGTCVLLVIYVPDIRNILGFVGATSFGCLIFILPSLFYLKTKERSIKGIRWNSLDNWSFLTKMVNFRPWTPQIFNQFKENKDKLAALIFLIFGCCFSLLTLGVITATKIQSSWDHNDVI